MISRLKYVHLPESKPFDPSHAPFFYGYVITLCATLGIVMSAPGQTIGFSAFVDLLIKHLGLTRFQLSLAYTLGTIGSSLIIGKTGKLLDTYGIRIVSLITSMLFGLVLVYMSQVDRVTSVLQDLLSWIPPVLIAFIAVSVGFLSMRYLGQGVLTLSSRTMLMKWFITKRGRMNSIMGVFVSLSFSGAPLVFDLMIRRFTWRGAWIILAVIIGVAFSAIIVTFFRDNPEASGLYPDGVSETSLRRDAPYEEKHWTVYEAKQTRTFWIFNIGLSLFALFVTAVTFHIVSIFTSAGHTRLDAMSIFLPASILAVGINLTAGWLSDQPGFKLKYLLSVLMVGMLLTSCGVLLLSHSWGKLFIIVGNGIASGMFGTLSSVTWPKFFGREHLGSINGYHMSFLVFASAVGPTIFGWAYNAAGTYHAAILFCIVTLLVLLVASAKADDPNALSSPSA